MYSDLEANKQRIGKQKKEFKEKVEASKQTINSIRNKYKNYL
jgi:hypothetical protein